MAGSVPVALAQRENTNKSHQTEFRTRPNQEGAHTTNRNQANDHQWPKNNDSMDTGAVHTYHKEADSRMQPTEQNNHKDSKQSRYESHHSSNTRQHEQPDDVGGKHRGETAKYANDHGENRNAPTDRGSTERNSHADDDPATTKHSGEHHSNQRQHQPKPKPKHSNQHTQERGQHSRSSHPNGRDSSSTTMSEAEKLHNSRAKEDGNDLTDFGRVSAKETRSSTIGDAHDPTGDGNIDWNSKVDPARVDAGSLKSNISADSSSKMPVVYCSVILFLLVSAYQLKPH